jgi:probable F420-dependent oxidoreductase
VSADPRFAISLPQIVGNDHPALIARHAKRAEELGFTGIWTLDSAIAGHTSHMPLLDGLHALTFAAAHTQHIRLGIAVIVLPRRNPALLAKELVSIDVLSGGRLVVGVGLGGGSDGRNAELGFPVDRRARRLTEGVEAMLALWTEERASYDGELLRFSDLTLEPKPVQRPHPPLWFGAGARPALRRAVRLGDAWIGSGSSSASEFAERIGILREELDEAGRDPATFPIAKRVYIAVEDDEQLAVRRLTTELDRFYNRPGVTERVAVCGTPERCAEELRALLDLGAVELVLNPLYAPLEQLEALAEVRRLTLA